MMFQHPLFLGRTSTKLRGVWVRNKRTGYVGYIVHVERPRNREGDERPLLWIVYPPGRQADGNKIKTWSAGSAYTDEVKRLRRKRRKV